MSKTLLNGINEVLKKAQIVTETQLLTSLTNSGKQVFIDQAKQAWNEAIDELYTVAGVIRPSQMAESSITLVSGTREYTLKDNLIRLHYPLLDETNGQYVNEYPGGYEAMRKWQSIPQNYTGLPLNACIRPDNGRLYFDAIPQAAVAGRVYKYIYDKDTVLTLAEENMPFNDVVFRAMVPVVFELYRAIQHNREDEEKKKVNYGRAASLLNRTPQRESWR